MRSFLSSDGAYGVPTRYREVVLTVSKYDSTKVNVLNRAHAGRSSRTFITQGWWADSQDQAIGPSS